MARKPSAKQAAAQKRFVAAAKKSTGTIKRNAAQKRFVAAAKKSRGVG